MPNDDLTFVEKSVLLVLMAEVVELPNVELTNRHRIKVAAPSREKLKRLGLIKVRKEDRRIYWELTDVGWKRGLQELGAENPEGGGSGGAALYAILGTIRRYLDKTNVSYQDLFLPADEAETAVEIQPTVQKESTPSRREIEARIRSAYAELARRTGDWVKLADLRDRLGSLPRADVDAVLVALNRTSGVNLAAEANQKTLTKRDRNAAVAFGNQDKHAISIGA